jgi:hypothetical protein
VISHHPLELPQVRGPARQSTDSFLARATDDFLMRHTWPEGIERPEGVEGMGDDSVGGRLAKRNIASVSWRFLEDADDLDEITLGGGSELDPLRKLVNERPDSFMVPLTEVPRPYDWFFVKRSLYGFAPSEELPQDPDAAPSAFAATPTPPPPGAQGSVPEQAVGEPSVGAEGSAAAAAGSGAAPLPGATQVAPSSRMPRLPRTSPSRSTRAPGRISPTSPPTRADRRREQRPVPRTAWSAEHKLARQSTRLPSGALASQVWAQLQRSSGAAVPGRASFGDLARIASAISRIVPKTSIASPTLNGMITWLVWTRRTSPSQGNPVDDEIGTCGRRCVPAS